MPEPWSSMSYESRPAVQPQPVHVAFGREERIPRSSDSNQSIEVRTISSTTLNSREDTASESTAVDEMSSRLANTRVSQYTYPSQTASFNNTHYAPTHATYAPPPGPPVAYQGVAPAYQAVFPGCNGECLHGRPERCPVHTPYPSTFR